MCYNVGMSKKFYVSGMTCSACAKAVEKSVCGLDGVKKAEVNLLLKILTLTGDVSDEDVISAVKSAGFGARSASGNPAVEKKKILTPKIRLIFSFIFLIPLFTIAMGKFFIEKAVLFAVVQFVLTIPIIVLNYSYFTDGAKAAVRRAPNMSTLIGTGSGASFLYSVFALIMIIVTTADGRTELAKNYAGHLYFESSGMILTLITLGKFLEEKSKGRTTDAIEKLIKLAPDTARVLRDGDAVEVPLSEVESGETVLVKTGERIPLDGEVISGGGAVDASAITGESLPKETSVGDEVVGGTLLLGGYIEFRTTAVGEDTALMKIVRLVEEASASKAPISRLADKIAGIFVPSVMSVALVCLIIWLAVGKEFTFALSIAIAVLVISCPCALGLATPVAVMVGTGKGAEQGILIKSAESLELLHKINCVVLDKTGTITEGRPRVAETEELSENFKKIAFNLERLSSHPLAEAVISRFEGEAVADVSDFGEIPGRGVKGKMNGVPVFAGSRKFMEESGIDVPETKEGFTAIYVAEGNNLSGVIYLTDTVKPDSAGAIAALKAAGIKTVMLTGDAEAAARRIFEEVKCDEFVAEVLPCDKEKWVRTYREKGLKVAMVGDGINDAPALTRADVGIAIGAGTDIAVDSADIVLVRSNLTDVVRAMGLSGKTIKIIKENLFWAFGYNVLGIPIAGGIFYPAFGFLLNPMIAAACMSVSSVTVVLNALRLRKYKYEAKKIVGRTEMKKTIKIKGMKCEHCAARIKTALAAIENVRVVEIDLKKKTAEVTLADIVSDADLTAAITDAGYEAIRIK